eukprot:6176402-Pleurochrysis_carterae.AAC.1
MPVPAAMRTPVAIVSSPAGGHESEAVRSFAAVRASAALKKIKNNQVAVWYNVRRIMGIVERGDGHFDRLGEPMPKVMPGNTFSCAEDTERLALIKFERATLSYGAREVPALSPSRTLPNRSVANAPRWLIVQILGSRCVFTYCSELFTYNRPSWGERKSVRLGGRRRAESST